MASKKKKVKWMSLPTTADEIRSLFRKGVKHPAMELASTAIKMKRSPNQVFILLVGLSGAGKSSTINYLLGEDIAATSGDRSKTRETVEYILEMKSKEWKIPDLPLSVVDTPGFNDTDGLEQDARNLLSIKDFFKQHPSVKDSYPNLVMITVNITDNRIEGKSSHFVKMLKGISTIGVVDVKNPNVIAVLTHAGLLPRKVDKWEKMVQQKKEQVKAIVRIYTGVDPEVVVQENKPDDYELEEDGDYHILPNKERQPLKLFEACKNILNTTGDKIGHEALVCGFRSSTEKNITQGQITFSSKVDKKEAKLMHMELGKEIVMPQNSEVSKMLDDYNKKKNVDCINGDILILQMKLRDLGIENTRDLQSLTINDLAVRMYPTCITVGMTKILEEAFGVHYEQMSGMECIIGKGFNMFADSTTSMSPLELEPGNGGLPQNIELNNCCSYEIKCCSVEDNKQYIKERLAELKIGGGVDINFGIFNMQMRAGYNNKATQNATDVSSMKGSSFLIEHRLDKITMKAPYKPREEFKKDVNRLPSELTTDNEENFRSWKQFMDKWGTHVIVECYRGGSLSGNAKLEFEGGKSTVANCVEAQAALNLKIL